MGENTVSIKWKPQGRGWGGVWEVQRVQSRPSRYSSLIFFPPNRGWLFVFRPFTPIRIGNRRLPSPPPWGAGVSELHTQEITGPLHTLVLGKTILTPGQQQGTISGQNNSDSYLLPCILEPATWPWEQGSMHTPMCGISRALYPSLPHEWQACVIWISFWTSEWRSKK